MDRSNASQLVAGALAQFRFPKVREWASRLLVAPRAHQRKWDYGCDGEEYECWLIAELPGGTHGIVYSDHGHTGWGLVRLDYFWFGPDSYWFALLEDAFIAGGYPEELPPGYEIDG